MSKNAWRVANITRDKIRDAPVMGDFITTILAEKQDEDNFSQPEINCAYMRNPDIC